MKLLQEDVKGLLNANQQFSGFANITVPIMLFILNCALLGIEIFSTQARLENYLSFPDGPIWVIGIFFLVYFLFVGIGRLVIDGGRNERRSTLYGWVLQLFNHVSCLMISICLLRLVLMMTARMISETSVLISINIGLLILFGLSWGGGWIFTIRISRWNNAMASGFYSSKGSEINIKWVIPFLLILAIFVILLGRVTSANFRQLIDFYLLIVIEIMILIMLGNQIHGQIALIHHLNDPISKMRKKA